MPGLIARYDEKAGMALTILPDEVALIAGHRHDRIDRLVGIIALGWSNRLEYSLQARAHLAGLTRLSLIQPAPRQPCGNPHGDHRHILHDDSPVPAALIPLRQIERVNLNCHRVVL